MEAIHKETLNTKITEAKKRAIALSQQDALAGEASEAVDTLLPGACRAGTMFGLSEVCLKTSV